MSESDKVLVFLVGLASVCGHAVFFGSGSSDGSALRSKLCSRGEQMGDEQVENVSVCVRVEQHQTSGRYPDVRIPTRLSRQLARVCDAGFSALLF